MRAEEKPELIELRLFRYSHRHQPGGFPFIPDELRHPSAWR
jgi:hypothetical protein